MNKKYIVEAIWNSIIYERVGIRLTIKALLLGFVKELLWRKKYLETIINDITPKKTTWFVL